MHLWLRSGMRSFFPAGQKYYGLLTFYSNFLESCKLDFLKAFIWQVYFFFLSSHFVEQQTHGLQYRDLFHISVTGIKKQTNKPTTNNQPTPPHTLPTREKPDVYILILVVGKLSLPRLQECKQTCVSVCITVLFFLSPIVLFGHDIFPWTTHVW